MIDPKDSATVFVDVTAYNSKNYYVQGEVVLPGTIPVTGTDTVLDAINYRRGLDFMGRSQDVVVYRQTRKGEPPQALHVDIDQITMGDDLSTNYQLLPGDRLVVPHNPNSEADRWPSRSRTCHATIDPAVGRTLIVIVELR